MPGLTTTKLLLSSRSLAEAAALYPPALALYTEENPKAWSAVCTAACCAWERYANEHFLRGSNSAPRIMTASGLEDSNGSCALLTGFQAKAGERGMCGFMFFDCLRNREFPTTSPIRRRTRPIPASPISSTDLAGHVPMPYDANLRRGVVRSAVREPQAANRGGHSRPSQSRVKCLPGILRAMARFFWSPSRSD